MPEASDPTPSEHEPRDNETKVSLYSIKEYGHEVARSEESRKKEAIMLSRGRELSKAGSMTGVKS